MSESDPVEATSEQASQLEKALAEIAGVQRVIRVEHFVTGDGADVVLAKVSLPGDLQMHQVSIIVTLAERKIRRVLPDAKHISITPDVYLDESDVPSTSAIVTLSYD